MSTSGPGGRTAITRYSAFVVLCAGTIVATEPLVSLVAGLCAVYISISLRFEWLLLLPGGAIFRRLLRTAVYFLPLAAFGVPPLRASLASLGMAVAIAVALLAAQRHEITLSLDRNLLALRPPLRPVHRALNVGHMLAAAPAQEYLHRLCVIVALAPHIGIASVVVGVVTFHVDHAIQRKRFDFQDIVIHSVIGISCGLMVYLDQSWLSAVVLHALYNLPSALEQVLRPKLERTP
jgi:hypothetical protein